MHIVNTYRCIYCYLYVAHICGILCQIDRYFYVDAHYHYWLVCRWKCLCECYSYSTHILLMYSWYVAYHGCGNNKFLLLSSTIINYHHNCKQWLIVVNRKSIVIEIIQHNKSFIIPNNLLFMFTTILHKLLCAPMTDWLIDYFWHNSQFHAQIFHTFLHKFRHHICWWGRLTQFEIVAKCCVSYIKKEYWVILFLSHSYACSEIV